MSESRTSLSRRELFSRVFRAPQLAVAGAGGLAWAQLVSKARAGELALRPPGALPEDDFLARCIKCGQCSAACPYGTLRIATVDEPRPTGTPYFEPREVPCYMCPEVPCARACPTGALDRELKIEDAEMGLAVLLDQETCLAFQGLRCELCYRACPVMGRAIAIEYRPQERTGKHAFFIPVVNSEACTGCGSCERVCPTEVAAIKVLPRDVAKGKPAASYRFGWKEQSSITREFRAPAAPPGADEDNTERVLREMEEPRGLAEP
jgi:ferredoxin-type protein NapG